MSSFREILTDDMQRPHIDYRSASSISEFGLLQPVWMVRRCISDVEVTVSQ